MGKYNGFILSDEEKEQSIKYIIKGSHKRFSKGLLVFLILTIAIIVNIFPLKPQYKVTPIEDFNLYNMQPQWNNDLQLRRDFQISKSINKVTPTRDGNFIMLVTDKSGEGDQWEEYKSDTLSVVIKYDKNYNKLWTYGGQEGIQIDDYIVYVYDLVETTDSHLVGLGKAIHIQDESKNEMVLIKLDSNGNLLSHRLLNQDQIEFNKNIDIKKLKIVPSVDGGYTVAIGYKYNDLITLAHYSTEDKVLWKQQIKVGEKLYNNEIILVSDQNNHYYLSRDTNMIKISPTGKILWEKNYDFNIHSITITNSNDLIVSGSETSKKIMNNKVDYLLLLKSAYESDHIHYYGGDEVAVIAKLNPKSGKILWQSNIVLFSNIYYIDHKTIEEADGYLYSYINSRYISDQALETVVKFDRDGNKLGEVILIDSRNDYSNVPYVTLENGEFTLLSTYQYYYRKITVDEFEWTNHPNIIYDQIQFYQQFLYIRVWFNRLLLVLILFTPYLNSKYEEHKLKLIAMKIEQKSRNNTV